MTLSYALPSYKLHTLLAPNRQAMTRTQAGRRDVRDVVDDEPGRALPAPDARRSPVRRVPSPGRSV